MRTGCRSRPRAPGCASPSPRHSAGCQRQADSSSGRARPIRLRPARALATSSSSTAPNSCGGAFERSLEARDSELSRIVSVVDLGPGELSDPHLGVLEITTLGQLSECGERLRCRLPQPGPPGAPLLLIRFAGHPVPSSFFASLLHPLLHGCSVRCGLIPVHDLSPSESARPIRVEHR